MLVVYQVHSHSDRHASSERDKGPGWSPRPLSLCSEAQGICPRRPIQVHTVLRSWLLSVVSVFSIPLKWTHDNDGQIATNPTSSLRRRQ